MDSDNENFDNFIKKSKNFEVIRNNDDVSENDEEYGEYDEEGEESFDEEIKPSKYNNTNDMIDDSVSNSVQDKDDNLKTKKGKFKN